RDRGVSARDARAGIGRALEELRTSEEELLRRAARKKASVLRADDVETRRRRLYGYLRRRGFRHGAILDVMEELEPR
ncbi:MAG: RecX family transcriptional regulator, partial [Gemmatimonadota bacterium]|nr:RecX family transcriptional regulator [Gemmatimonadota bacterium]